MQMVQVPIGNSFPVVLGCFDNGTVALLRPAGMPFKTVIDLGEVNGSFLVNHFSLYKGAEMVDLEYNTCYRYKEIPLLLAWLKQQNLQPPQFQGGA